MALKGFFFIVVKRKGLLSYSSKYEIIKNSEKNNRNEAHDDEVSKLEEIN